MVTLKKGVTSSSITLVTIFHAIRHHIHKAMVQTFIAVKINLINTFTNPEDGGSMFF